MDAWKLTSLEIDYPGEKIGEFLAQKLNIRRCANFTKEYNKLNKKVIKAKISACLNVKNCRPLTFMGSGNYHHYTYGICCLLGKIHKNYGYIHIDQHTDHANPMIFRDVQKGEITCGSFVPSLLSEANASALLLIGSTLTGGDDKTVKGVDYWGMEKFSIKYLKHVLKFFPEKVYLSFDLDVMKRKYIYTNWGNDKLTLKDVYRLITEVKKTKTIIGADILGYGDPNGKKAGKRLYLQIASALIK